MQQRDHDLIDGIVALIDQYDKNTCNTNSYFRAQLSAALAKRDPYKFHDFAEFISDAETMSRVNQYDQQGL